jgi:branched-chain amino acid transport system ATP-binding protein
MLEVRNLRVNYGRIEAVRGIDFSADPGRVTLVLGANGAGKTTTLRATVGLVRMTSGEVVLDGAQIQGLASHRIARRGLTLIPEGRRIFGPLTVEENLKLGAYPLPRRRESSLAAEVFDMFPILYERRNGAAGLLSGGEQQMLAFGRALMCQPRVILMDEPSMGLAPVMVESVLHSIRTIADTGIAVLMVEQNAEVGLEIADDVVIVARGEIVFAGPAESARSNTALVRAFLGDSALAESSDS